MFDQIGNGLSVASTAIAVGSAIYVWLTARSKANAAQIEEMTRENHDLKTRMAQIETELKYVPTMDSFHRLEVAIAEVNGSIQIVAENSKTMGRTVNRINEYMMSNDK